MQNIPMNARKKRTIFVGGLDDRVTEELLQAAFIPFGDIKSVSIPKDFNINTSTAREQRGASQSQAHAGHADKDCSSGSVRGYGFVEFEEEEDAVSAIDNMNGAELFQRTINVYWARPMKTNKAKAIWAEGQAGEKEEEEEDEAEGGVGAS